MSARFALALLLAAATLVDAARADEAFDAFRQFCVEAHGDESQALALADSARWMPLPQTLIDQLPQGQFLQPKGRLRTNSAAMMMLVVAHGPAPVGNLNAHLCAVVTVPGDLAALQAEAEEFAQVPKDASAPMYAWRDEYGTHVAVGPNTPNLKTLMERGAVNFMTTRGNGKWALVLLMVPSK